MSHNYRLVLSTNKQTHVVFKIKSKGTTESESDYSITLYFRMNKVISKIISVAFSLGLFQFFLFSLFDITPIHGDQIQVKIPFKNNTSTILTNPHIKILREHLELKKNGVHYCLIDFNLLKK